MSEREPLLQPHEQDAEEEGVDDIANGNSLQARVKTALASPARLTGLEKALALGVIVLVLLSATGFGLFAAVLHKRGHRDPHDPAEPNRPSRPLPPINQGDICISASCVQVASRVINSLNTTVDPCDNFYEFANGGWLQSNPIPEGKGFYGSAQDIDRRNQLLLESILDVPYTSYPIEDQKNIQNLQNFYASCLNEDVLKQKSITPLLDLVDEVVNAWRGEAEPGHRLKEDESQFILGEHVEAVDKKKGGRWDPTSRQRRFTATVSYLHSRGVSAFFEAFAEGDVRADPSDLVLWITQEGLGLPSKDYYKDKEALKVYQKVIKTALKSVYSARKDKIVNTKDLAKQVLDLEVKVAKVSMDVDLLDDPQLTYNPKTVKQLENLFPAISFTQYASSFNPRPTFPNRIIVTSPDYLGNLTEILDNTEEDVIEAYFITRIAQAYSGLLSAEEDTRQSFDWLHNFLGGIPKGVSLPRKDYCLTQLLDNYGFLIGRYYVQRAFPGESQAKAEDTILKTIEAFKRRLPELKWLDKETREKAEEKASAIRIKVGFPTSPNTSDAAALERYYSLKGPITADNFFENVLKSRLADQQRMWMKVGRKVDPGAWEMIPSEVNAYYSPPANEIVFPAGILQAPYFDKEFPDYMRFGAFGSIAGHELSHAFDQAGRQYDKTGRLVDWWTNKTSSEFKRLQQCLLDQYAQYPVYDESGKPYYIKSQFTNGEDMADAGGVQQSFRAWSDDYKSQNESDVRNLRLPGLDFTREQLFFIAYAQGWARNVKPAEAVKRIRTDPHSPTNYRVIGVLSNDENFSKAFGCKAGDKMSNVKKCHVW